MGKIVRFLPYAMKHPGVRAAFRAALFLGGLDLLVGAAFWFPIARGHHLVQRQIDRYRRSELEAVRRRGISEAYSVLSARVKVLGARWETGTSQAELIQVVGRLASRRGLRILSQDFDVKNEADRGGRFLQNLSLAGTYPSLRGFLADLDRIPALTVVQKARLEREGGRIRARILLCTYCKARVGSGTRP